MDNPLLKQNAEAYNNFPYISNPFAKSLPALHQAIGKLFGLNPPDLNHARVLELGCASGGNIIPMTFYYPDLEVVGVDLSQIQIQEGQQIVEKMGLQERVKLHNLSITDIPESFGKFDYIICHGVYSWVPDFVQEGIFNVIRKHLKVNGLAYISYNIYPGWKSLEIARDAMLFHTRNIHDPKLKVDNARAMIEYMHQKAPQNTMFKRIMDDVSALVKQSASYYLAHEFLETHNSPIYFSEMAKKAKEHGLMYLSEAEISSSFAENWGDAIRTDLINASNNEQLVIEQYLDYINNRQFRQSLFMLEESSVNLNRNISPETIRKSYFSVSIQKESTPRSESPDYTYFIFKHNTTLFYRTCSPSEITALDVLCQFNQLFFNFNDYEKALKIAFADDYNQQATAVLLQRLVISGLLNISGSAPATNRPVNTISAKPKIADFNLNYFPLREYLVNARNEMMKPDLIQSILLPYINGQHSEEQLTEILLQAHKDGRFRFNKHSENETQSNKSEVTDNEEIRRLVVTFTRNALQHFLENGMLVG